MKKNKIINLNILKKCCKQMRDKMQISTSKFLKYYALTKLNLRKMPILYAIKVNISFPKNELYFVPYFNQQV